MRISSKQVIVAVVGFVVLSGVASQVFAADGNRLPAKELEKAFLNKDDVPKTFVGGDVQVVKSPPGDERFVKLGGLQAGRVMWSAFAPMGLPLKDPKGEEKFTKPSKLMSIQMTCWEFPDAAAAKKYLTPVPEHIHDGAERNIKAPPVGSDCTVFGVLPASVLGLVGRLC